MDRKVAANWMLLDGGDRYRYAAYRAAIIHKEVERHEDPFVMSLGRNRCATDNYLPVQISAPPSCPPVRALDRCISTRKLSLNFLD